MFVYGAGASHDGYNDTSFEPHFEQPEVDDATKRRAIEICGGADAKECIVDYLMSGKESVARNTAEAVRQYDSAIDSAKKRNKICHLLCLILLERPHICQNEHSLFTCRMTNLAIFS